MFKIFSKKDNIPVTDTTVNEKATLANVSSDSATILTRAMKALKGATQFDVATSTDTKYNEYASNSDLIYSCVTYVANAAAQVRFKPMKLNRVTGESVPYPDTKLTDMFNGAPNGYQTWTELLTQECLSMQIAGNSYTAFEVTNGKYELWNLLAPQQVTLVINEHNGKIKHYLHGEDIKYKVDEVIHNRLNVVTSIYTGSPVITSLIDQLTLEGYATSDLIQFYENSSVGSTVLSSDVPLTQKQVDDLKIKLDREYSMANRGRHKMFILPNNLKPVTLRMSPKEAMLLDSLTIAEDRILQVFKIHKSVLGGSLGIHYTHDMESLSEMVFNNAVRPYVNRFKDKLQTYFQTKLNDPDLLIDIDYSNIPEIHRAVLKHAEKARLLNIAGLLSHNEARELLGLAPTKTEYADKHFIPQHLIGSRLITLEDITPELLLRLELPTVVDDVVDDVMESEDPEGGVANNDTASNNAK